MPHRSPARSLLRIAPQVRPAGPAMVVSVLVALGSTLCGLVVPLVIRHIIDGPIAHGGGRLWLSIAEIAALGLVEVLLLFVRRTVTNRPLTGVEARMRTDLYHHLQAQPVAFHERWQSGQLLSRATNDLNQLRMFLSFALVFLIVNFSTFAVGVGLLVGMDAELGLVILAMAVPMMALCYVFDLHYRQATRRAQDQVGDLATVMEESVLGIRVLKSFGRHRSMDRRFARLAGELRGTELHKVRLLYRLDFAIVTLPELAIALTLFLGVRQIADGRATAGELVAFFTIVILLRWPIESVGLLLANANDAAAATDRYFEVMDARSDIVEPTTATEPARHGGVLRMEGVRFRFPDAPEDAQELLRGVDLEIRAGESVALVGGVGCGKTTLTALVPRLYDPTGGRITLDGTDVKEIGLGRLRTLVSMAFEEPILFSASVRENVLLGFPEGDDADVRRALRVAQAGFVEELPHGLDTRVGEQGLNLSGGQRQRLALARAVVSRPAFLVLDDPLSALDVHTEALVEQALRQVLATTTALVVAHRPSTVLLADRVALLHEGRIAALGTHAELLAREPRYRHLVASLAEPDGRGVSR